MHCTTSSTSVHGLKPPVQTDQTLPTSGSVQSGNAAPELPLGITAKSSTPPVDQGARIARAHKYQALAQARVWIGRRVNILKPDEQFPGNVYRTFDCRYVRTSHHVSVHRNEAFSSAHYKGIATCGSVWACPVCAGKIQERRRLELEHLVEWADSQALQALMVTLTFPHRSFHSLADLLEKQADAFKRFRAGSPFRRLKESIGFSGLVRSLEVTHGQNGWHPHTHELWLVNPDVSETVRYEIQQLWERACIAAGLLDSTDVHSLHAFRMHAVDVRLNATSGQYLAKQDSSRNWGITHEVAKASSKAGRAKGVHPHEFLVRAAKGDEALYFEYLEGMKGKRQLFWSPGLKARCSLPDASDEQIVSEESEVSDLLGRLSQDEWQFIRKKRVIAQILDVAETGGWPLIERYLKTLGYTDPPPDFGTESVDLGMTRYG